MVQLSNVCYAQMKTFGWRMSPYRIVGRKNKVWNHRKPIKYQRFMSHLDPDEVLKHYSRDDLEDLDPKKGSRTYKVAQQTIGRRNYLLPKLSDQNLESNDIFQKELERQRAIVARIDKIRVIVDSQPGRDTELSMNKDLSSPYDCARHIHELLTTQSVVAEIHPLLDQSNPDELVNAEMSTIDTTPKNSQTDLTQNNKETHISKPIYWDMHRPLETDCRLKFRHFTDSDVNEVNKIYWRSCSFVLGMAVRQAFKDGVEVLLHSWPKPSIKSGSFVYDVALNLSERWKPSEQELRALTKIMWEIKSLALPFERMQVDRTKAQEMFRYNPFKLSQIDSILEHNPIQGKLTVYRCGGLLDMSVGPMISNTNQIGRISLAAVHPFDPSQEEYKGMFYRFQGVSLPQQLPISSYLYQHVLINQAKKLNTIAA